MCQSIFLLPVLSLLVWFVTIKIGIFKKITKLFFDHPLFAVVVRHCERP